jgi:hypothetical protein
MNPDDMGALVLVALGSGSQQLGHYIYAGATHELGVLSSLQESQATGYSNDLALRSYDFFAPIGEFGNLHGHFHLMRRTFLTVQLLGPAIAAMPPYLPQAPGGGWSDNTTLRWSVRCADYRAVGALLGAVFINTYQRPMAGVPSMQAVPGIRLNITVAVGPNATRAIALPDARWPAITFPANKYTIWPLDWRIMHPVQAGEELAVIAYATAQPLAIIVDSAAASSSSTAFLAATDGLAPELYVTGVGQLVSCPAPATCTSDGGDGYFVRGLAPSTAPAAAFKAKLSSWQLRVVVLSEAQALSAYVGQLAGQQRLLLSESGPVLLDPAASGGSALRVRSALGEAVSFAVFPPPSTVVLAAGGAPLAGSADGVLVRFETTATPAQAAIAAVVQVQQAGPPRVVPIGPAGVAMAPDQDGGMTNFTAAAAVFNVTIAVADPLSPLALPRLAIRYTGDCLRVLFEGQAGRQFLQRGRLPLRACAILPQRPL